MALLIGFALDQQVTVQKAFMGPMVLRERAGSIDAVRLADMPLEELEAIFRKPPALHRFPAAFAKRVQDLAVHVVDRYGGDAARLWTEATDGPDLQVRIRALPGFGQLKVGGMTAVLAKRLGVQLPRIQEVLPTHPTLGDVDSADALAAYQAKKRAYKASLRESGEEFDASGPGMPRRR